MVRFDRMHDFGRVLGFTVGGNTLLENDCGVLFIVRRTLRICEEREKNGRSGAQMHCNRSLQVLQ
jgi:hypothetical protein